MRKGRRPDGQPSAVRRQSSRTATAVVRTPAAMVLRQPDDASERADGVSTVASMRRRPQRRLARGQRRRPRWGVPDGNHWRDHQAQKWAPPFLATRFLPGGSDLAALSVCWPSSGAPLAARVEPSREGSGAPGARPSALRYALSSRSRLRRAFVTSARYYPNSAYRCCGTGAYVTSLANSGPPDYRQRGC